MDEDTRWRAAQEVLLELIDMPSADRRRRLDDLGADDPELANWVERLLALDPGTEILEGPQAPRRFGPYEVVRTVGHGGMGEVVVARRADGEYEHEVAIKLLRGGHASDALVQRFLRERQTLARLDHEYIARLLDGGTTDAGEPYLVMEYVDGEQADVFAARLDLRERLELFVRIGEAVTHAHDRGVVHRDLKPGNVLVRPDGKPRLLDFGIARPSDETRDSGGNSEGGSSPLTRTGHRLFTPEYASPEQIRGETATERSDVFALGVLLYVFLAGEGPWGKAGSLHDLERVICEVDPAPPSRRLTGTARRRLSGDLDAIILQCLEKRPARRYGSVAELCKDIERHLSGATVLARRTHTIERIARYVRRRPLLPVAAALTLVASIAAWRALDTERRGEDTRVDLSVAVVDRLEASREKWLAGDRQGAVDELDTALADLEDLPPQHALEAELLAQKAVFSNFQGDPAAALETIERAERTLSRVERPEPVTVAKLLSARTYALQRTAPGEESEAAARAALEFARANLAPGWTLRTDAMLHWANELQRQGDADEAFALVEEAIAESRALDPKAEPLARMLNGQAVRLVAWGRIEEGIERYREALQILEWLHGGRNPSFARVRLNFASALFRIDRYDEALEQYELSLEAYRSRGEPRWIASAQHFIGRIHSARGDQVTAEAAAREAVALRDQLAHDEFYDRSVCQLGIILARAGKPDEARLHLTSILDDPERGPLLPDMESEACLELAAILRDEGDTEAAAALEDRSARLASPALLGR